MASAGRPLLRVRDLRVEFRTPAGTVRAVNGVDFDVHAGETLAIVGESGSGKTVTALALVGLVPSPPAQVRATAALLDGSDLLSLHEADLATIRGHRIGFVFQDPLSALNPVLTVGRQVGEVIERHLGAGRRAAEDGAARWLARVGIADPSEVARAYPHQLSGGMRQRAMIAMALAGQPDLLIADEPTTALDVTVQAQIVALMRELRRELDMALIWISHDLGVVASLADRVAVMYAGRIVETASVRDLYGAPMHPYTRGLIASVPSVAGTRPHRLPAIPGSAPNPIELPPGCSYYPRCDLREEDCRAESPELAVLEPGHRIACEPAVRAARADTDAAR